jgi:hypothetical protein
MIYDWDTLYCMYHYMFMYSDDPNPLWLRDTYTEGTDPTSPAGILLRYGVVNEQDG